MPPHGVLDTVVYIINTSLVGESFQGALHQCAFLSSSKDTPGIQVTRWVLTPPHTYLLLCHRGACRYVMLFASILPWAAPLVLIYTLVKLKQVSLSV